MKWNRECLGFHSFQKVLLKGYGRKFTMSCEKNGRARREPESAAVTSVRQPSLHCFFGQASASNLSSSKTINMTKDNGNGVDHSGAAKCERLFVVKGEPDLGVGDKTEGQVCIQSPEYSAQKRATDSLKGLIVQESIRSLKRSAETAVPEQGSLKVARLDVVVKNENIPLVEVTPLQKISSITSIPCVVGSDLNPIHDCKICDGPLGNDKHRNTKPPCPVLNSDPRDSALEEVMEDAGNKCLTLKSTTGLRVPAPLQAAKETLTEYEKERMENVRRNQLFLKNLGIDTMKETLKRNASVAKPKRAYRKIRPSPELPLRRSTRMQGLPPQNSGSQQSNHPGSKSCADEAELREDSFPNCENLKDKQYSRRWNTQVERASFNEYMCGANLDTGRRVETSIDWSDLVGYQTLPGFLLDPHLTRIYTMDLASFDDGRRSLLAAGGHKGQISLFGTSMDSHLEPNSESGSTSADGLVERRHLLSWKGGGGWISQVQFLSQQPQEATLLLSSSNDGSVVLWDLKKQQGDFKSDRKIPPIVFNAHSLHTNGIFSMHELAGQLATGSKDFSLACSMVKEAGITRERVISGHHDGAIRSVRFREPNILADGGADRCICILDLRLQDPCALTINSAHLTAINVVEWSPNQDNILLSASTDPQLYVYDIRSSDKPLHTLVGHVKPQLMRCSSIYRPAFVGDGSVVVTPGEGSKALSLYSVGTGMAISRRSVDFDPSMVMGTSRTSGTRNQLWAAGKYIVQFAPITNSKTKE